ncbi:MAG: sigma-70 family RNA polymerase sigma factor [Armatimonadetes bacterium]|nr:MAG: sigma-70 family RNA polymerase sigma factor [Armatimonadota bacterium]
MEPLEVDIAGALNMSQHEAGNGISDQLLVARCQSDDWAAFDALVDRYQARVFGFVRRMVPSHEEAEDIAQEVFVRAFRNIHRYDGRASVAGWLFKIATNLCIDSRRKRSRRVAEVPLEVDGSPVVEVADPKGDPEPIVFAQQMEEVIASALDSLSERLKPVILLHDVEGLSYEEIANALGIPVGTVKSRLFLARERLQQALSEYMGGDTSHG